MHRVSNIAKTVKAHNGVRTYNLVDSWFTFVQPVVKRSIKSCDSVVIQNFRQEIILSNARAPKILLIAFKRDFPDCLARTTGFPHKVECIVKIALSSSLCQWVLDCCVNGENWNFNQRLACTPNSWHIVSKKLTKITKITKKQYSWVKKVTDPLIQSTQPWVSVSLTVKPKGMLSSACIEHGKLTWSWLLPGPLVNVTISLSSLSKHK